MTDLPSSTRSFFSDLLPNLSNTVLIYDKPFEQVIKWSCPGGFGAFLDAGVIALRSLETISEKVGKEFGSSASMNNEDVRDAPIFGDDPAEIGTLMNVTSVLFLISTHLARHSDVIRYILHPRPPLPVHPGVPGRPPQRFFKECRIVCSVSEVAHVAGLEMEPDLVAEYEAYLGFERYFGRVESKVKAWMSERGESYPDFEFEEDPVVIVEHLPLVYATISNDLFVIPSDIFPRLYPRDEGQTVKSLDAPTSFDRDTRDLAASISSMLESMNLKEEYFVLGETSKSVSRCIIAQSMTSPRRKSESNVAVILVDRTYDLATPVSHSDNLIDQMRNVMGDGSMDVMIDSTAILPEWDQGGPATLSHGSDPDTMDLLTVLTMLGRKDGLVAVRKRIVDLIGRYVPDGRPKVLGKVTLEQLERLLRVLVDGSGGIGGSLLETVAGVVEGVREGQAVNWDELMAIERVIAMSVAEAPEASSVIAPIRDVVSQGLQRQSGTSTPPHLRTGTPPHSPSPASSRLPSTASSYTGRSSTVEARNAGVDDALRLMVFGFGLLGRVGGGDKGFGEEEEMLVRDALVKAVMSDAGFGEQDSTSALWRKWRKDVDEWTNDCVRVLKRIMGGMQKTTSNPFSGSSPQGFQSLIRRIALEAAHTPSGVAGAGQTATGVSGMDELVHVPYGGTLGSVLSGFSRLLGGGNRLRPGHFSRVIIFVVGGMTCMEMRDVREAVREASGGLPAGGTQIMVGSTGLLSGVDVVRRLFPQVPRTLI